jgi:hypothetical protein
MPVTTKKTSRNKVQKKRLASAVSGKSVARSSSRKGRRLTAVTPPAVDVTPKGLLALSTEYGVFVAMTTPLESAMLADFRLAAKDPFPRVIAASAKRCRVSVGEWRDDKAGTTERLYVAFIPTPPGAMVEGTVLYGAKVGRAQLFASTPTQRYAQIEAEKQKKILYLLQPRLIEIASDCLPEAHPLMEELGRVTVLRREQEAWAAVQETIRGHLERKDGRAAVRELEPLVFTAAPKPAAEKLLSEILLKSNAAVSDAVSTEAPLAALKSESLMLSYLLGRLSRKADREALPSPTG